EPATVSTGRRYARRRNLRAGRLQRSRYAACRAYGTAATPHSRSGLSPASRHRRRACGPARDRVRDSRAPRWHRHGFRWRDYRCIRIAPYIVVDSRKLGLAHPVGPHDPGAKPLRMVDQDMKRRPLDGNARSLEPDTQLSENIVNEALIARVVGQPVHNVAVRMRGDGIDFWRRVHILLPSSDLDRRYRICRVPARRRQWSRRNLLARIGLSAGSRQSRTFEVWLVSVTMT